MPELRKVRINVDELNSKSRDDLIDDVLEIGEIANTIIELYNNEIQKCGLKQLLILEELRRFIHQDEEQDAEKYNEIEKWIDEKILCMDLYIDALEEQLK